MRSVLASRRGEVWCISCDSFTQLHCDHVEKWRNEFFKLIRCSSKELTELTSLKELKENHLFHLLLISHFFEERDHTYFLKKLDLFLLESCVQFENGHGDKPASMHEVFGDANDVFWDNHKFCSEKAAFLSKKMEEKSGYDIDQFTVGVSNLSWHPGIRTGQAKNHLYSKPTITRTWHEQYRDMFPKGAIPESSDIDECYDKKYLLKHRAEAQKNCRKVAENIKNGTQQTLNYVDTTEFAFSFDYEKNQEVKLEDRVDRHLQVYLEHGYEIFHTEDDLILLYTKESNSFVFFLGPLCKLLGKFSFDTSENIESATRQAVLAEIIRQLCNMAKGRPDGGKDDIFGNILLAHYLATLLHLQLHMTWMFAVAFGKDILTPRELMSQDREYSQISRRERNTLSIRTYDSEGRDGVSTGDFDSTIFYLALNIYSCYPLEEARVLVAKLFKETGANLTDSAISARNRKFGNGNYLSPELQCDWITFYQSSVRQNSGNSKGRRQTPAEKKECDRCIGLLIDEVWKVIEANPDGGDDEEMSIKVWLKTTEDEQTKARAQNSDANEPNVQFEEHLQLPFFHGGLFNRFKKKENPKYKGSFRLGLHKVEYPSSQAWRMKPFVTRKNYKYKLAIVQVNLPE